MAIDLIGQRFGLLNVVARLPNDKKHAYWWCKCDCGKSCKKRQSRLRAGETISCGCKSTRYGASRKLGLFLSGAKPTPTYKSWANMKHRCTGKIRKYRGVTHCERWNDFANFLEDMGERPEGMSLDRIDTRLGYNPENCRWADASLQNRNRRFGARPYVPVME